MQGFEQSHKQSGEQQATGYNFECGYPVGNTSRRAYDENDLNRAVEGYKFFYPTVSGEAIFRGNEKLGIVPNKVFGTLDTKPIHVGYTLNSDTPYAPMLLDLSDGPMVVELPSGPLICISMDVNQLWIADLGLPGPAAGKGDKVVFLPPGYTGDPPIGYRAVSSPSNTMLTGIRSLPVGGDVAGAIALIKTAKVYPLKPTPGWPELQWLDLTPVPQDTTPLAWENNIQFWQVLAEVVNREVANPRFHMMYGELAALGIEKGKPFAPDARMTGILEKAAKIANAQMRVESFDDRKPERIVWPDRKWEWAALGTRTATSTRRITAICMRGTSGFIRRSGRRRRCSNAIRRRGRCTGWGRATRRERISTAGRRTSWWCLSRCQESCSGA